MRRHLAFVILATVSLTFGACILDPEKKTGGGGPPPDTRTFKSLKEKDDVLHNLELAYESRNFGEYQRLLDDAFSFSYPIKNVDNVFETKLWFKATEERVTERILIPEKAIQAGLDPVTDITLNLFATGLWIEKTPTDTTRFPNETWHQKQVEYFLQVEAGPNTYISNNTKAQFVVRFAAAEGDSIWRIVSWLDDLDNISSP